MSGNGFFEHYRKTGGFLNDDDTDDGTYRPWVTVAYNNPPNKLLLVPARQVSAKTWRIPYLQVMVQEFDRETGQLCLMFPVSGMTVFLEGRGLEELDDLIERRSVKSVHMFDEALYQPVGNDAAIVTQITVEKPKKF